MAVFSIGTSTTGNTINFVDVQSTGAAPVVHSMTNLTPGVSMRDIYDFISFTSAGQNMIYYNGHAGGSQFNTYIFLITTNGPAAYLQAAWSQTQSVMQDGVVDNLNSQDYIYTMLLDVSIHLFDWDHNNFYLAVLQISQFEQPSRWHTPQTGDIYCTHSGSKCTLSSAVYYKLFNAGTAQLRSLEYLVHPFKLVSCSRKALHQLRLSSINSFHAARELLRHQQRTHTAFSVLQPRLLCLLLPAGYCRHGPSAGQAIL